MSEESSAAINIAHSGSPDRAIGANELIKRMAEDLRIKSGSDLPLSCFIEQVKMQLAGRAPAANSGTVPSIAANARTTRYHSSDLFRAWAMPE